ncbi:hypothetical protein [Rhizobium leguminosarum]|uniref:hypothetical protein n=1 Tax=Rhizobium leguminosarum TaxID=384 RepID=UPI0035163DD6
MAEREAWEEAGVIGRAKKKPFGEFVYDKLMQNGNGARLVVAVFLLQVRRCRKRFPEMAERDSSWLAPFEAARRVEEPDLERLLLKFGRMVERRGRLP